MPSVTYLLIVAMSENPGYSDDYAGVAERHISIWGILSLFLLLSQKVSMTKDFTINVLICGAGAAGLTLVIDLARRGISSHLIEKMDDAFRGSRSKGLQPRTLEIFEDVGIVKSNEASRNTG
jgi:hypothetical protein